MKKAIFWGTMAAGVVAAYLMVKRGAPLTEVLTKTLRNPFGTLANEVQSSFGSSKAKETERLSRTLRRSTRSEPKGLWWLSESQPPALRLQQSQGVPEPLGRDPACKS